VNITNNIRVISTRKEVKWGQTSIGVGLGVGDPVRVGEGKGSASLTGSHRLATPSGQTPPTTTPFNPPDPFAPPPLLILLFIPSAPTLVETRPAFLFQAQFYSSLRVNLFLAEGEGGSPKIKPLNHLLKWDVIFSLFFR
jgi:hypothetical protein